MSLARKRRTDRDGSPALPQPSLQRQPSDDIKREKAYPYPYSAPSHPSHPSYSRLGSSSSSLRNSDLIPSLIIGTALTLGAFIVRFWRISHPDQVVFDEVHFGSFAGHYIRREYYFDVHPPLAKMLNAAAAWVVGFDGVFGFENIGDSYTAAAVPYVGMRSFCAIMGAITVPVVYAIMRESGYPLAVAAFSAGLILFDNGHITQTRLILLDAALVLFMALSVLTYIKFHQQRYREFTASWWGWMLATGAALSCTLGCKMVGLFTFLSVGAAVVVDLWGILDVRKNPSMKYVWKHIYCRALGLIVWPFILYLSFFWVHFKVLKYSGPGDTFMSPAFQETLSGNEMLLNAQEIRYYDTLTIKHKDTKQFLHSHDAQYPLRYDDGRISSQGQQVTCYPHNDTNNNWQILPTRELPESGRGRVVRHHDVVQLLHVNTNTLLLTHDVASPLMPTNQEFTTVATDNAERYNETLFQLDVFDAHEGEPLKSLSGHFKLRHQPTRVLLWTHATPLPEWAFGQQEVNGNKNNQDRSTFWFIDDIVADGTGTDFRNRTTHVEPKAPKRRSFIKKFVELQILMLQHNAALTSSHPYASESIEWPFCLSGVSFWTNNDEQQQIYMIGNLLGWWICAVSVSVFVGIVGADMLARRRGMEPIEEGKSIPSFLCTLRILPKAAHDPRAGLRNRLYRNTLFFLGTWSFHYFPFFLMSRQKFLHHYLPAHLASALVAGAVLNFVLVEAVDYPVSVAGIKTRLRPATVARVGKSGYAVLAGLTVVVVGCWLWLAPFTYGMSLTGEQVNARKLLSSWSLHFEAKITDSA